MDLWKDIPEYEGFYKISNTGNVRSIERYVSNGETSKRFIKSRILKTHIGSNEYLQIKLYKYGTVKTHLVHKLVADVFIPNPECKPEVNHINGIKTDNITKNLEWLTHKENMEHAVKTELITNNHLKKQVICIETKIIYNSSVDAEKQYNLREFSISNSANPNNRQQTAGGYHWEYVTGKVN